MKILLAIVLVLVQALTIQASFLSSSHPGNDIDTLCAGKSVDLITFSQLKQLHQAAESSACSSTLKSAITGLVELINNGKDDLCSVESISALRAYYGKYLDTSGGLDDDRERLPKSLKRFVLAYGMQMSNLCKKNMISVLSSQGNSLVDASDFEHLDMLIRDDGPVAQFLGVMGGPGEVFLPGDLISFFKKHNVMTDDGAGDKFVMQTATADYIKKMQSVCQHRFKPVYGPLMMPLVRLVNIGFNYKDEPLKCDLACPKTMQQVSRWSRIVFLCEALANARIVEDKDSQLQAEGSSLVRILTEEEADAIEAARPPTPERDTLMTDVAYVPHEKVKLDDVIYDKADKQLRKFIKSFKTNHDEDYILRKRVSKKGFELIRKQLKGGHFGFILSAAWKGMMRKNKAVASTTKQFVEILNEVVEQQHQAGGTVDGPVSKYDRVNFMIESVMFVIFLVIAVALALGILAVHGFIG